MRKLRALWFRLWGMFSGQRGDSEFAAELESHVAMHTEDGIRAGLSPEEARRQALIRLGGAEQTRQAQRERRGLPALESLLRDLAYGMRTLRKHTGVTAIAVLSIGLGIGANATIFSMISRFVLRPPPMGDPSTLVSIHTVRTGDQCCNPFSWPEYTDLREQAKSFSDVATYFELIPASISGSGVPERVWGQGVTTNFFDVIEVPMMLGRGFVSSDENAPAVVLGAGLWQRRFNADKDVVGKTVMLSGHTFTVVGVAPRAFHSVDQILYTEFWVPLDSAGQLLPDVPSKNSREFHWLPVVARIKPGVTQKQVAAELRTLALRFARQSRNRQGQHLCLRAGRIASSERAWRDPHLHGRPLGCCVAGAFDRRRQCGQSPVCAGRQPSARYGRAPCSWRHTRPAPAAIAAGECITGSGRRPDRSAPFPLGHAGAFRPSYSGSGSPRCQRQC